MNSLPAFSSQSSKITYTRPIDNYEQHLMDQLQKRPKATASPRVWTRLTLTGLILFKASVIHANTLVLTARANNFPLENLRHKNCLGTRGNDADLNVASKWSRLEYNCVIGPIANASPKASNQRAHPCATKKVTWQQFHVDTAIELKNQAHARVPSRNTSRRKQTDNLAAIINDPQLEQARALLCLLMANQSSAQKSSSPSWYREADLIHGDTAKKRYFSRLDNAVSFNRLADFYIALFLRHGNEPRSHSRVLGEYFRSEVKHRPITFKKSVAPPVLTLFADLTLPTGPATALRQRT